MKRTMFRNNQTGAVLFMALVFLVLITVMAVTTFTISKGTSQVVNNMNLRKLTLQTANQTSDAAMSTSRIITDPTSPLLVNGNFTSTVDIDVNGDGKTVIRTTVQTPTCYKGQPKANINLDLNDPVQAGCANSVSTGQQCYDITFQYPVKSQELYGSSLATGGAQNTVTQGASVVAQPAGARNICHGTGGQLYF